MHEHDDWTAEAMLHDAAVRLIHSTPGAQNLNDVSRLHGRPFEELLAEETALPIDQVVRICAIPFELPPEGR
ncbi:MAG: hypothetical protein M5U14_09600 [Acidimicrobiia bacterium]|nr:hypothetical protein [Acidimicrobiia bacterium]